MLESLLYGLYGAGQRPYKMVLVIKRGKTTPLSYKLVVERAS